MAGLDCGRRITGPWYSSTICLAAAGFFSWGPVLLSGCLQHVRSSPARRNCWHLVRKRDGRSLFHWSSVVFHHWFLERWFWAEATKETGDSLLPPGTLCQPWHSAWGHARARAHKYTHSKLLEMFQLAEPQGLWQLEMEWGAGILVEAAGWEGVRGKEIPSPFYDTVAAQVSQTKGTCGSRKVNWV